LIIGQIKRASLKEELLMRNIIIGLCIAGIFLEVSGLIWSSKADAPTDTFIMLTQPPARTIDRPQENGYFLLLGFAAPATSNPVQTGYDTWMDSDRPAQPGFDVDKPGRSELRIPLPIKDILPEWYAENPIAEFQRHAVRLRTSAAPYNTWLTRYHQWLAMRFEDWGYARRGTPRPDELFAAHRWYIAEGFSRQARIGTERWASDVAHWRHVLSESRSLPMKVLAQVMIEDDLELLSRMVNHSAMDHAITAQTVKLLQPLTAPEYSLRWPVQSEFVSGHRRSQQAAFDRGAADKGSALTSLAQLSHLPPDLFHLIEHPPIRRMLGTSPASQRTWNIYAAFYEATIKTAETVHSPLPKLRDVAQSSRLTLLEQVTYPFEFEPAWEPFSQRLVETDARLRLASLQLLLRKSRSTDSFPARLAEVGSMYFDPFTGFPMLWSPTQRKLYSVGKDGLDDGGDPTFDLSVPFVIHNVPAALR
jgi:hypothetical protein